MSTRKRPRNWPAEQKLKTVQEYDALPDEEAQGRFLRERGLYSVDIQRWLGESPPGSAQSGGMACSIPRNAINRDLAAINDCIAAASR